MSRHRPCSSMLALVGVIALILVAAFTVSLFALTAATSTASPADEPDLVDVRQPARSAQKTTVPEDAAWPPVPVADPDPIEITIPVDWPEGDKEMARLWVTIEQDTRSCMLARGIDYRYLPVWERTVSDDDTLVDGDPPADWESHLQRPFMHYLDSANVCFNRALVSVGRTPHGSTEFATRTPRFEPTDFADPETLDMPSDWSDEERADGRRAWEAELLTRSCMADAGYPSYGLRLWWFQTEATYAEDPWVNSLPLDQQEAAQIALNGAVDVSEAGDGGCSGRAYRAVDQG